MRVEVRFWGVLRRIAAVERRSVDLIEGATIAQLADGLSSSQELADEIRRCAFAIGLEIVPRSRALKLGDEVDVLPPVAGG